MTGSLLIVVLLVALLWLDEHTRRRDAQHRLDDALDDLERAETLLADYRRRLSPVIRGSVRIIHSDQPAQSSAAGEWGSGDAPKAVNRLQNSPAAEPVDLSWITEPVAEVDVCQPSRGCEVCGKAPSPYRRHIPQSALSEFCHGHDDKPVLASTGEAKL